MLDFLNSVFLPSPSSVDHDQPRKAGLLMLRKFLHGSESSLLSSSSSLSASASKVKRGGMKLESIPLLHEGILSSCCEDEDEDEEERGRRSSGMKRVKILMGKEAAARLLSNCTSNGGVLQFKNLPSQHLTTDQPTATATAPTPLPLLLSTFKTKYD